MPAYTHSTELPTLNLPPCPLTVRQGPRGLEVWDGQRHRYVALTPEEWVRQHVLHLLCQEAGYPKTLVQVEGSLNVNGLHRRCDVVVYRPTPAGHSLQPVMIVECKQPAIALTQRVVDQACRYNSTLQVPYLFLTNGMKHLCLQVHLSEGRLQTLPGLPPWSQLACPQA